MVSSGAGCEVSGAAGAVGAGSVGAGAVCAGAVSCFGAFFSVVPALVGAAAFVDLQQNCFLVLLLCWRQLYQK